MWAYVLSGNTARFGEFLLRHFRDIYLFYVYDLCMRRCGVACTCLADEAIIRRLCPRY